MAGGEFSNVWTLAEAAARQPFDLGHFLELVWENTSGYLLAACLVSLTAALLSWVYMVRAGVSADAAPAAPPTSPRTRADTAATRADNAPNDVSDDASDGSSDDPAVARGPPPPPPPPPPESAEGGAGSDGEVPDLVEMAHHLPARVKQAELKHIRQRLQSDMTEEQKQNERRVERDQMAAILELMQQNSDKFGQPSLEDMQAQLKLYM